ncbi:MAG: response regulator, partial [Leptospiraceae bacterium]|nr:response regulator [Leptospiraceae bacterium]
PLNAILGLTDLLMRQSMNPEHERLIEVIHSSGDTLLRLLNDLLEATQLQGDELNLRIAPVDLHHVLETTLLGYQYHARRSNTQLQYSISQDFPARVLGDAGRLKQIITNIVSNAIKYAAGGSIEVALSRIPSRQADHCRVQLLVSDNGPGIPASEQDSIFQIFSRVNNPGDDLVPGVGLGLYIVKQLVNKMDGCITVRSPSGMGTPDRPGTDFLVELEFKVISEEAEGGVERPITYEFRDRPRILVAEDNPPNQILIGRMLEEMRCEVTLVDNGEEATREARNGKYDLIILDINMPLLGGFEASRIIRSYNSEVPIVALSAAAENPPEEKLHSCGMSRYLVKPVWQADLFTAIRDLTGKN